MKTAYRTGIALVSVLFVLSLLVVLVYRQKNPAQAPEIPVSNHLRAPLGSFRFVDQTGSPVTDADLADDVWVASFVFTRCPSACPRILSVLKSLRGQPTLAGVKFVTVTVDPEHDTPAVLKQFAATMGLDTRDWRFLTGDDAAIQNFLRHQFHVPVEKSSEADLQQGADRFTHSNKLVLVDRGNEVAGYFDSTSPPEVARMTAQAHRLRSWTSQLPAWNASLNGLCAITLIVGWVLIRLRHIKAHAVCMSLAVLISTVFLISYLTYHYAAGSVPYQGTGASRILYFSVLLSHTILASVGVVPLVVTTLSYALGRRFDKHAYYASITLPIWIYVSITGVLIYGMLYHLPTAPVPPELSVLVGSEPVR